MAEHSTEKSSAIRIVELLQKNAKVIIIALVILVVVAVAALIGAKVVRDKATASVQQWEVIEDQYNEFVQLSNDTEGWEDTRQELIGSLDNYIATTKGKGFGDMQARAVLGHLYVANEEYAQAAEAFLSLNQFHANSYAAPMALFNAAAAYEEAGDTEQAMATYQEIIDTQDSNPMADMAKAHFYLGRVAYQSGNIDQAVDIWNNMITMYQEDTAASEWIKLAKTVLLTIE